MDDHIMNNIMRIIKHLRQNIFVFGFVSLLWFMFRTGLKPSRAIYPCQRAAASNSLLWLSTFVFTPLSKYRLKASSRITIKLAIIIIVIVIGSFLSLTLYNTWILSKSPDIDLDINEDSANGLSTSNIFVVNTTSSDDQGITTLIDLMGQHGLQFYKSERNGTSYGPTGLISHDDVVIIKINCQWDQRGGTNTDLLKAVITIILKHPDGFIGEIIVADNGQGRGSLDWSENNAENRAQSAQRVVDSFSNSKVSTYLWDDIRQKSVSEYVEGDINDGYVVNQTSHLATKIKISYPKFQSSFGTYISFKRGVWNPKTKSYEDKLKVINVPVLKTHSGYGVTASIKHYMGVVSQPLTNAHSTVGYGGMGTEMVQTRFPVLNILDAIWVNAIPRSGPRTSYSDATQLNLIAASTDPVALDYWASKYVLMPTAIAKGHTDLVSMDPENSIQGSFGDWLRLSMQEIISSGYKATVTKSEMNIYSIS